MKDETAPSFLAKVMEANISEVISILKFASSEIVLWYSLLDVIREALEFHSNQMKEFWAVGFGCWRYPSPAVHINLAGLTGSHCAVQSRSSLSQSTSYISSSKSLGCPHSLITCLTLLLFICWLFNNLMCCFSFSFFFLSKHNPRLACALIDFAS